MAKWWPDCRPFLPVFHGIPGRDRHSSIGRFGYSPDAYFGTLYELSIDPDTGEITGASAFSGGGLLPTIDPSGKFLYMSFQTIPPQVRVFAIDGNTGSPALTSTTEVAGYYPGQVIVTP